MKQITGADLTTLWQGLNRSPMRAAWIGTCLATLSLLLWQGVPFLFDWDELIYGSLARHMVLTGRWWELALNDLPFWEKPPFFFWTQAIAFQVLGISETSARLPSALAGGALVGLCLWIGSRLQGPRLGWIWGLLLATGWLPLLFAKTGLIDPLFNLWMMLGLFGGFLYDQEQRQGRSGRGVLILAALALGIAVLTKGPLGLGLPVVIGTAYKLWHRQPWPRVRDCGIFIGLSAGVALSWFVLEIWIQGPEFVIQFTQYQWRILNTDVGHPGPIYFHLLAYGLGCFPFAALSLTQIWVQLRSLMSKVRDHSREIPSSTQCFTHLMLIAFGMVLGLFSLVVQTKLIHYTSLLYPIGTYFAALQIEDWWQGRSHPSRLEIGWIWLSGLIWVMLLWVLPWIGQHPEVLTGLIEDPLTQGYLNADVVWPWWTYSSGVVFSLGVLIWGMGDQRGSHPGLAQRWGLLLLSTWLSGQLFWAQIGPRILEHTQGGAVRICQRFQEAQSDPASTPLALYGPRSFIPYFYGPQRVPYTEALWQLIPWVENDHVEFILTWQPQQAELMERLPLVPVEGAGAYVLLQVEQTISGDPSDWSRR